MVVTHLAKKAGLNFETYFNVTTLDVAESNRMAKRNGFKHILPNPEYGGFYKYIQRYDGGGNQMIPSRLNRFCCNYFKESPTIDYFPDDEPLIFLFGILSASWGGLSISPIQTQKQGVVEYKRAERSARQLQHRIPASALLKKQIIPANPLDR